MSPSLKRAVVAVVVAILAVCSFIFGFYRPRHSTATAFDRAADTNILLVTIDTLRADALGSYGGHARTPNLDKLAAEGERFDFAHAHVPLTRPSHASIMTGLYPFQTGVRDHSGYRMKPDAVTIAMLLKQAGFATGAFVGAVPLIRDFGLDKGFDVYDDHFGHGDNRIDFSLAERPAAEVVAAALKWIGSQGGRWFVWVHVFDPHAPYTPPPPFDKEYADHPYLGEVAYVDQSLGPLLDTAASGSRPTFTIVTADHGEGLGDHGELTHGLFAYESTLHVPLIIADLAGGSGHGHASGSVSHYPARHVDILPTLLDAAALTPPPGLPGHSLLRTADLPPATDVSSYFEAMSAMLNRGWAPLKGVVEGYDKYIDLPIPELYHLQRDPHEQTNLAERERDHLRVLAARLAEFRAPLPGDRYTETPEVAATLQSLGYTSGSAPKKDHYTEQDDPKTLVTLDQWIQQGIDAFQQGKTAEAFELYERVIDARPSMPLGYKNLAFLQWQSGDAPGAIATLERAMHAGATTPDMATQLGSYLAQAGKASEAVALLEPIVSTAPDPDALNALGIAYAREGRGGQALGAFQSALKENPENEQAFENIGVLELGAGHLAEARTALEKAVAINPRSSQAHNGLGVIAMRSGRTDEAFDEWKRAVALAPHDYDALFNLAMELSNAGRHDEARSYLERFVKEAPPSQYGPDIARAKRMLGQ